MLWECYYLVALGILQLVFLFPGGGGGGRINGVRILFWFFPLKTDLVLLHLHIYGCKNKVAEQSSELLKKPFILHS